MNWNQARALREGSAVIYVNPDNMEERQLIHITSISESYGKFSISGEQGERVTCYASDLRKVSLCRCGSRQPSRWVHDGRGIPLCRVCDACEAEKLSRYRPEILTHYTQDDVLEPIEPEEA